jgi:hypothetical protein
VIVDSWVIHGPDVQLRVRVGVSVSLLRAVQVREAPGGKMLCEDVVGGDRGELFDRAKWLVQA